MTPYVVIGVVIFFVCLIGAPGLLSSLFMIGLAFGISGIVGYYLGPGGFIIAIIPTSWAAYRIISVRESERQSMKRNHLKRLRDRGAKWYEY